MDSAQMWRQALMGNLTRIKSGQRTIVLIHGLFPNWESWGNWVWPGREGTVAELRADPAPLKGLTMKAVADHFDAYLRTFPTPPIVMGTSFGGFFAELLAHRELCFELVTKSPSLTAYEELPGRPHFTGGVPGWEAVADYALDWALNPIATGPEPLIR